jgi:hypothetical protein
MASAQKRDNRRGREVIWRTPMNPSEHFMRHEAECKFMARLARDPESKAIWMGMAERWHRCAELAEQQNARYARRPRQRRNDRDVSH